MFPSGPPGLSGTPGVSRAYGSRLYCASTIDHDDITASFTHSPFIKTVEWEMLDKRFVIWQLSLRLGLSTNLLVHYKFS